MELLGDDHRIAVCAHCARPVHLSLRERARATRRRACAFLCSRHCLARFDPPRVVLEWATLDEEQRRRAYVYLVGYVELDAAAGRAPTPESRALRELARAVRQRDRDAAISPSFLALLWRRQAGRCAVSGLAMTAAPVSERTDPYAVTLDRIDPARGYRPRNIRLVCRIAAQARRGFSDAQLAAFCTAVAACQRRRAPAVTEQSGEVGSNSFRLPPIPDL